MNKAFTKEPEGDSADDDAQEAPWPLPPGVKNYMTPSGERALRDELDALSASLPAAVTPAARRASERRISAIARRLAEGEVVDPTLQPKDQARFGARVTVRDADDEERTYWIVGVDQADPAAGNVSWQSVIARALIGGRAGDVVVVRAPGGERELEIVRIDY